MMDSLKKSNDDDGDNTTQISPEIGPEKIGVMDLLRRTISKNDYIIEYLRNIEEEETDNVYLMKITEVKTLYINEANSKSLARFINYSCNPNSELVQLCVDGLPCMCFYIAIKDIKCKKEITLDSKWAIEEGHHRTNAIAEGRIVMDSLKKKQ